MVEVFFNIKWSYFPYFKASLYLISFVKKAFSLYNDSTVQNMSIIKKRIHPYVKVLPILYLTMQYVVRRYIPYIMVYRMYPLYYGIQDISLTLKYHQYYTLWYTGYMYYGIQDTSLILKKPILYLTMRYFVRRYIPYVMVYWIHPLYFSIQDFGHRDEIQ